TGFDGIRWRTIAPGLSHCEILPRDLLGDGTLRLLRIAKGKKLPRHGHTGTELTLVLKGAYSDATGQFMRGDLAETDEALVHEPISGRDEDCVCLIATEGRLKFDSAIVRIFRPFTGF
ncbi:MAG: cupin domain-containing protein, partial [Stellaceae bacterium]